MKRRLLLRHLGSDWIASPGVTIIFLHPDLPELVNLQNVKGKAKPYQIKQLLKIIEKHNLHMEDNE
jgi:hypothetical protein